MKKFLSVACLLALFGGVANAADSEKPILLEKCGRDCFTMKFKKNVTVLDVDKIQADKQLCINTTEMMRQLKIINGKTFNTREKLFPFNGSAGQSLNIQVTCNVDNITSLIIKTSEGDIEYKYERGIK